MKIYLVGGAVRDGLLSRSTKDRDYVVVGSTPEEMLSLGYQQVGAEFPVFLHPETKEEYALARTERKSGTGYHGFVVSADPSVTLEDDLRRRDLTINSMARDLETGELIDPFGGQQDLKNGILRHTSEAFQEDPLRVLRVARFAARYGFSVAFETRELMRKLVECGEMKTLTTERVWLEFEKAMMEKSPARFISLLWMCEAWGHLFPEISAGGGIHALNHAATDGLSFDERVVALFSESFISKIDTVFEHYSVSAELSRLAHNVNRTRTAFMDQEINYLSLLKTIDAFRRPEGMKQTCNVLRCLDNGSLYKFADCIEAAYHATASVNFATLTPEEQASKGAGIGQAIDNQRQQILDKLTFTY